MTTPFEALAREYVAKGWPVMPVKGKDGLVVGATGYKGTVTPEKTEGWLINRPSGYDSISIRHQGTMTFDVDEYTTESGVVKHGAEELRKLGLENGLSPLPATWSSTARGPLDPSRQYVYEVPETVLKWRSKPCTAVELCVYHHRHTLCWPSIHPDKGTTYTWYGPGQPGHPPTWGSPFLGVPPRHTIARLPQDWIKFLDRGELRANDDAVVIEAEELFKTFAPGEPDGLVRHRLNEVLDPKNHIGHDEYYKGVYNAVCYGREGRPGVQLLIEALIDRYTTYVSSERPDKLDEVEKTFGDAVADAQRKVLVSIPGLTPLASVSTNDTQVAPPAANHAAIARWVKTFTRCSDAKKLGRRIVWMNSDELGSITYHAEQMVKDSIAGAYPAKYVLEAITSSYLSRGGSEASAPRQILTMALTSVVLSARSAA